MNWLEPIISKKERLVIGLVSGTSMDGIDAALVRISGFGENSEVRVEDFICREYSLATIDLLLSSETLSAGDLSDLNFLLGKEFSSAVSELLKRNGLLPTDIDLVGTHGQTIFHNPPSSGGKVSSTLQLGEADVICQDTGITTIGDFRTRDIAAGGEGAPLVPFVDFLLFSKSGKHVIAQNIGGISNCTLITDRFSELIAFDTGPGNSLIDSVVRISSEGREGFDKDGAIACEGSVKASLLQELMKNSYLEIEPPKSTGKELFGDRMATELFSLVKKNEITLADLLRTLVEFTACSIISAYEKFVFPRADVKEIILSGGGAKNPVMVSRLREKLNPRSLSLSDDYGIPIDAKEAVAFAVLANETIYANPSNVSAATGALVPTVLGKISIGKNRI